MAERDPLAGDVLVASVLLADGVFNRTVVLVLDCDEDGALGVILNEISQTRLDSVLPDWVSAVSKPQLLFHGGPVSPNGAICLASVASADEEPPGWRRLFDSANSEGGRHLSVGLLHLDTPIEIVAGAYRDLRIFAGYSGWAAGQLQAEIAEGMWHVLKADYSDIFGAEPLDLWRQVLRRQQSTLALFSTWVEDPGLN
jgi:putative transcriptional regulator